MQTVTVSLFTIVCLLATLVVSLVSHSARITLYMLSSRKGPSLEVQFPIAIQPATLTMSNAHEFGFHTNDSNWDAILPKGAGFFYYPENQEYYFVTHYHQLHCLGALRRQFLASGLNATKMGLGHVDHCLIYLRQTLLCNVDMTLEPVDHYHEAPNGILHKVVTGLGVDHRCLDWSQVWEFMDDNYETYQDTYRR
ncbi:hypothetical protein M422DRAFT_779430 [Sphaerobolus stellatus SS14]|uniref:Uncharacterized protein n=1 Tax=Sphaerobolus stellatus (strain SS14) TaxID=990650 RepID=A0A0C9VZ37_SPHS4|nr:hypothetical protein M422DRAFT_779430 [Sphaerobolus stellatus SS14]